MTQPGVEVVSQPRSHSLAEVAVNTATGVVMSLLAVQFVFPWFGVRMDVGQNFAATGIMTVVSLARSYFWRRVFVWVHGRRG
jgi:hypothetical protein